MGSPILLIAQLLRVRPFGINTETFAVNTRPYRWRSSQLWLYFASAKLAKHFKVLWIERTQLLPIITSLAWLGRKSNPDLPRRKPTISIYMYWAMRSGDTSYLFISILRQVTTCYQRFNEFGSVLNADLLFISYKFVKGFLAITFLLLVFFSNWNFHDVWRFLYNLKRNFSWIPQKIKISP